MRFFDRVSIPDYEVPDDSPAAVYNAASAERGSALALLQQAATRLIDASAQYRLAATAAGEDAQASMVLKAVAEEEAQHSTDTAVGLLDLLKGWRDIDRPE